MEKSFPSGSYENVVFTTIFQFQACLHSLERKFLSIEIIESVQINQISKDQIIDVFSQNTVHFFVQTNSWQIRESGKTSDSTQREEHNGKMRGNWKPVHRRSCYSALVQVTVES